MGGWCMMCKRGCGTCTERQRLGLQAAGHAVSRAGWKLRIRRLDAGCDARVCDIAAVPVQAQCARQAWAHTGASPTQQQERGSQSTQREGGHQLKENDQLCPAELWASPYHALYQQDDGSTADVSCMVCGSSVSSSRSGQLTGQCTDRQTGPADSNVPGRLRCMMAGAIAGPWASLVKLGTPTAPHHKVADRTGQGQAKARRTQGQSH